MSQIRNNQVSPNPGNTDPNLSVPPTPQVGASSPDPENGQQGPLQGQGGRSQPQLPRPPYLTWMNDPRNHARFDDQSEKENPCRCCCKLGTAAKFFIRLNLVYLFLKFFFFLPPFNDGFAYAWIPIAVVLYIVTLPFPIHDPDCFVVPVPPIIVKNFLGVHIGVLVLIWVTTVLIYLLDVITTVMFMWAVCNKQQVVDRRILLCNVFMWYNMFYPGIILHLAEHIGTTQQFCHSNYTWPYWVIGFIGVIAWVEFSAFVARAYRNALRRERIAEEEGRVGGAEMSTAAGVNAEGTGGRQLVAALV